MYSVSSDLTTGIIIISNTFSVSTNTDLEPSPTFSKIGDKYVVTFTDIKNLEKFKTLSYNLLNKTDTRYLETSYRLSRNGTVWTQWYDLPLTIVDFPPVSPKDILMMDLRFIRSGTSKTGTLRLLNYSLIGSLSRNIYDNSIFPVLMNGKNSQVILKPPYIYKVFKITDIEILYKGNLSDVEIKYRYSQDYGRSVSGWEILTKDNISSKRISPIRFFQVEYLIDYISTNNAEIKIYDINIIGDFQNVTLDYQKTNLYGVRENSNSLKLQISGDSENADSFGIGGTNQYLTTNPISNHLPFLDKDQKNALYKPYILNQASDLLNKMSNDSNLIFGHEVVYFLTDPDKKGIDYTFHEYQLYNYVCNGLIKISVVNNDFPDNQIVMNQFDLSLFENFEVHVTKESFKQVFGVDKRPSKEDFLWFSELNRMFTIEHAQPFRGFNLNSIYYKIMLKKYTQKANIIAFNQSLLDTVNSLTKNSTIDELFGYENTQDKQSVANKDQFRPLTLDTIRVDIYATIQKELIENSENIISKTNYDLSTVNFGIGVYNEAVIYHNVKNLFKNENNISYLCWFNMNNYTANDEYNLFNYYDDSQNQGFKAIISNSSLNLYINENSYSDSLLGVNSQDIIHENIWYGFIFNLDQRGKKLSSYIYKRSVSDEALSGTLGSTKLYLVKKSEFDITPTEISIENSALKLLSGDLKMTNIRFFIDIVPESEHSSILNQSIIRDDSKYLILADNANKKLVLPNYQIG